MIDAIGVAGTPDQVRAGIARREADFDHLSLYSPSFTMTLERVQQNTLELIRVGAPVARAGDRAPPEARTVELG